MTILEATRACLAAHLPCQFLLGTGESYIYFVVVFVVLGFELGTYTSALFCDGFFQDRVS
jgi:hypothetical protein